MAYTQLLYYLINAYSFVIFYFILLTKLYIFFLKKKGLLCVNYQEDIEGVKRFQQKLNQLFHSFVYGLPANSAREKGQKMIDINLNTCRIFLRLGPDPSNRELDDLIYFLLSCYESQGIDVDYYRADILQVIK